MRERSGQGGPLSSNVEIFEQLLEAFNREGVGGVLPYFDEQIEIYDPDLPDGTYRGKAGLMWVLEQLVSGAESAQVHAYELLPAGDRVVALTQVRYSLGDSAELEVGVRGAHTMTFRDGKVIHWRLYLDHDEALAEAGLDPTLARSRSGE